MSVIRINRLDVQWAFDKYYVKNSISQRTYQIKCEKLLHHYYNISPVQYLNQK